MKTKEKKRIKERGERKKKKKEYENEEPCTHVAAFDVLLLYLLI